MNPGNDNDLDCVPEGAPRLLVACERSARVRDAFRRAGIDAWSCDLEPCDGDTRWHIKGDAIAAAYGQHWDAMIGHPECTYLANSSSQHLYHDGQADGDRWARMGAAALFFTQLLKAPIARKAIENPIMLGHPKRLFGIPEPTQWIQPWQFGHGEKKTTYLWLDGLPKLRPTNIVSGRSDRMHKMPDSKQRKRLRSLTYQGIANAMAEQWAPVLLGRVPANSNPPDLFADVA